MNWVEIATAGCRVTGTSKSGIASDILAVDGLGSIRRPNVAIDRSFYFDHLEILRQRDRRLLLPASISKCFESRPDFYVWSLQSDRNPKKSDHMDSDLHVFYILSLLIYICCGAEYAYTIEVDAGKHNCFFQTVNNTHHKFMEIDYQVVDGGDLNINFMLLLGTKILLQETKKVEGSHKLSMTESGDYQLCFDNSFSYQTRKVLFFELFLFDEDGSFDETNMLEEFGPIRQEYSGLGFEMQKFQKASNNIKNQLNKIEYHQSLLRAYEARDRAIMNANLERVTLWSAVNSIILVIVGLLQVYMIRSLFEDSSKLGHAVSEPPASLSISTLPTNVLENNGRRISSKLR
uniref:GOLD domain-containing protein n=1 Tax=Loa loa TaxID=7209 RepID=A0A1I7V830_LOALO